MYIDLLLLHLYTYRDDRVQYNMPQAALFVLFDFVIEHPCHEETRKNLLYMQIATSYFMRLQCVTGNTVFGTILAQFLQIATRFVECTCTSSITQPEVSANPRGSELWQSRDSGIGTIDFEESLGFQVRCGLRYVSPSC